MAERPEGSTNAWQGREDSPCSSRDSTPVGVRRLLADTDPTLDEFRQLMFGLEPPAELGALNDRLVRRGERPVQPRRRSRSPSTRSTAESRSKYWCFTLNNPTDEEAEALRLLVARGSATYLVYGEEVGASGTRHFQGYVEVPTRQRLSQLKQLRGLDRSHLELRRGTALEASTYCKKDGTVFEAGSFDALQKPGRRSDLESIRLEILGGISEVKIADDHFATWCYHRKSFEVYRQLKSEKPGNRLDLRVILLWGTPDTGKSSYAYARFPDLFRVPSPDLSWFTGYAGESTLLIDDYRGDANESTMLQLLDIYPMMIKVHYGFAPLKATTIVLTTNVQPSQLHNWPNEDSRGAFRRRIHRCLHLTTVMPKDLSAEERWAFFEAIDALEDCWM